MHAYFAEKETLLEVFDAWPDQMGVVVLLEEEGDGHNVSLYHAEEQDRVLSRLGHRLGLPRDELILISPEGVGPAADGHPRVRIKFSDDRKILDLLGHQKTLPERARDYKINFEYVRDQGLGTGLDSDLNPITPEGEAPLVFTPIPKEPVRAPRDDLAWGEIGEEDLVSDGEEPTRTEPTSAFPDPPAAEEDLGCFDVPAAPELVRGYRVLDGTVRALGRHALIRPRGHGRDVAGPKEVTPLGFRDDLSDLLLPPDALDPTPTEASDALALPLAPPVLAIPLDALPEGFLGPTPVPRRVRVSATPWGVRVRPYPGLAGLITARPVGPALFAVAALLLLTALALLAGFGLEQAGNPTPGP